MRARKKCSQCGNKRSIAASRSLCEGCRRFNMDVKAGRIKKPDYKKVTIERYKEPMEKVEDGFGYYGAITQTKDGTAIQCHICGYYFSSLAAHVKNKHKVDPKVYKTKYGLRIRDGLISPVLKERRIQLFNEHRESSGFGSVENNQKAWEATRERIAEGGKVGGDQWIAQTRNEKGMCREQVLAKIRLIANNNQGVVTRKLMVHDYGKDYIDSIRTFFGTWTNAVKEAGAMTGPKAIQVQKAKRRKDLIQHIRDFFKEHGHPPYTSDFNSDERFSGGVEGVYNHFRTLNQARYQAGVPILVFMGNGKWEEVAYE